jgi:hypothetical protein
MIWFITKEILNIPYNFVCMDPYSSLDCTTSYCEIGSMALDAFFSEFQNIFSVWGFNSSFSQTCLLGVSNPIKRNMLDVNIAGQREELDLTTFYPNKFKDDRGKWSEELDFVFFYNNIKLHAMMGNKSVIKTKWIQRRNIDSVIGSNTLLHM